MVLQQNIPIFRITKILPVFILTVWLTADFLRWLNKDLLDADIEEVIAAVNDAPHDYLSQ